MTNLSGLLIAVLLIGFTSLAVWAIVSKRTTQDPVSFAVIILAVVAMGMCAYGLYMKISELYFVMRSNLVEGNGDGAFAFTPLVNYMLASMGFLFMLVWAACRGMFHDIEGPKRTLLENEEMLNRRERARGHG
ncbi:MAG: hypothetical protein R3C10_26365 [Pirellulales bacterium]